jgi:hypothetical protein
VLYILSYATGLHTGKSICHDAVSPWKWLAVTVKEVLFIIKLHFYSEKENKMQLLIDRSVGLAFTNTEHRHKFVFLNFEPKLLTKMNFNRFSSYEINCTGTTDGKQAATEKPPKTELLL